MVLDAATLARILDGNVTRWLDPAIRTLNPAGVSTAGGVPVTDGSRWGRGWVWSRAGSCHTLKSGSQASFWSASAGVFHSCCWPPPPCQRITLLRGPVATSATLGSLLGASWPATRPQRLQCRRFANPYCRSSRRLTDSTFQTCSENIFLIL